MALMTCKKCGNTMDVPANDTREIHCMYCGAVIKEAVKQDKGKKKNKALLPLILSGVALVVLVVLLFVFQPWNKQTVPMQEVPNTDAITAVSVGRWHTVGLKKDGTVVAVGFNHRGQCDVEGWTDITGYSFEPWHVRYVGKEHAKAIYENQMPLEDYLILLRQDVLMDIVLGVAE